MEKILFVFVSILLITSCTLAKKQPLNWEANELFTQLSELRKEVNKIKIEVKALKSAAVNLKTRKNTVNKSNGISIDLKDSFTLGSEKAAYAIVEFTDYQCPYCAKHSEKTLPKIKQSYIDSEVVKYIIKDFPLSFHRQAKIAAISARCAGQQGEYWTMHDLIFANQKSLTKDGFIALAEQLGIDVGVFKTCLANSTIRKKVEDDLVEGQAIGVHGTPAFFIGRVTDNRLVDVSALFGAQNFASFSRILDSLIQSED